MRKIHKLIGLGAALLLCSDLRYLRPTLLLVHDGGAAPRGGNTWMPFNNSTQIEKNVAISESCVPPLPLKWEWNRYSKLPKSSAGDADGGRSSTNATQYIKSKNMLIAQFVGYDKYAAMLERTAPINKAYAKRWRQDFVVLQGTSYILPIDKNCTPPGLRTTLNKITLFQVAHKKRGRYDQVLILDTDAMIYDFNMDISKLLPDDHMVAGQRVPETSTEVHMTNINAGVLLWNLKHQETKSTLKEWHDRAVKHIESGRSRGDQRPLHQTLQKHHRSRYINSLPHEFAYGHGTVVRHFIRHSDHRNWSDPGLVDAREERISQSINEICQRFFEPEYPCNSQVEHVSYSIS